LSTVRYMVTDVDEAVRFYVDRLGFELVEQFGPTFARTRRGDLTLWLAGPQSSAGRSMPDGAVPEPGGWNRLVLETDDLAAWVERLRGAGARFRNEVVVGPGGSQILLVDPSGNVIELFQPA
jgi:catechol 2,3-dioxygenase-like lactoylglutathione lyase family enzyme